MKLHFIYNRINTILVSIVLASTTCMADNLVLRYERPADFFEEALVIGNGTLGATVYGGIRKDRLSLNDITLWTGITASAATPLPSPVIIANGETAIPPQTPPGESSIITFSNTHSDHPDHQDHPLQQK